MANASHDRSFILKIVQHIRGRDRGLAVIGGGKEETVDERI